MDLAPADAKTFAARSIGGQPHLPLSEIGHALVGSMATASARIEEWNAKSSGHFICLGLIADLTLPIIWSLLHNSIGVFSWWVAYRSNCSEKEDLVVPKGSLFRSRESRLLLLATALLHCFVVSSFRSRSSSHAGLFRRNSPRSSVPYPPACPALPGSHLHTLANTPESVRTPANGRWLASADRDHP